VKVALAQVAPQLVAKEANLAKIEKTVAKAGADLAMFGEMFLTGYMARDAFPRLAEPVPGPATERLARIATEYGTHVLVGMPERDAKGRHLFNTSVLVAPDGKLWKYRKIHPANFGPFEEGLYFGRGSELVLAETKSQSSRLCALLGFTRPTQIVESPCFLFAHTEPNRVLPR